MSSPELVPSAETRLAGSAHTIGSAWTGDIRMYYEIRGAGPWLVLSHSLACDHSMWARQIDVLAKSFRVLAYDTRGHGRTSAPAGPYSLAMLAEDLKAMLDALSISTCHFVGLSMGGMIGQTFALAFPGVFRSMALCDTSSKYPAGTGAAWESRIEQAQQGGMQALVAPTLERWFTAEMHRTRSRELAPFARQIEATPVEGYVACSRAVVEIDTTERLAELDLPTLVVVGTHDLGTPPAMARAIHERIRSSELVLIDGAAHFPNVERADVFNAALLSFLGRRQAPSISSELA